ncbi:MAG TPA: cyclic nucleotide-binding domain-containing protein [Syntrophales bacterium]|jgi:CRP-like cAMP-binding protein|nr:cyclic nucleotide-binding domain-containing protein [Syntrophales bacterium]HRT61148.1 cyclic nucleotide-binding domain-containing protein [Syntrophales bacterium]
MVHLKILRESNILKNLSDAQLEKLAAFAISESHPAGTLLYKEGDPANKFYLVEEGKVFLEMKTDMGPARPPLQVTIDVITKGEGMGWSAFVEPNLYTLSGVCMDATKLISFESGKLRDLMDKDPELGYKLLKGINKLLASRLSHTRILLVSERALGLLTTHTEYA